MNKKYIYPIMLVLFLTIIVIGSTYAFLAAADSSKTVNTSSNNFEVIYTGNTHINGPIELGVNKEDGLNTSVNIKVTADSLNGKGTIYLTIKEISPVLSSNGFHWEVIGQKNGRTVYTDTGNFSGKKNNDIVNLVNNYEITKDNTKFIFYFWLDGSKFNNNVSQAKFEGYIGAKTENISGVIS